MLEVCLQRDCARFSAMPRAAEGNNGIVLGFRSIDPHAFLNFFERDVFCLGHFSQHPDQLPHHAGRVEGECMGSRSLGNERKCLADGGGKDLDNETTESLAARSHSVGKDFADEHPDHRALADGV